MDPHTGVRRAVFVDSDQPSLRLLARELRPTRVDRGSERSKLGAVVGLRHTFSMRLRADASPFAPYVSKREREALAPHSEADSMRSYAEFASVAHNSSAFAT